MTGVSGAGKVHYPEEGTELTHEVEETSFWFRHRNKVLLALFERHPCEGRLWDIGGGNGFQAAAIQEAGFDVVFVEPSLQGCRNARKRGVRHVVQSTLEAVAPPEGRLDAVSFFDVLEHLENPAGLLRGAFRALRPGGRVYATVPAFDWLWSDEDDYADHQRRYTRRALSALLGDAGFRVGDSTYFFQCLLLPVAIMRALPYRLGRRQETMNAAEHQPGGRWLKILESLLAREEAALRGGRSLPFGTSVLCVATRPK